MIQILAAFLPGILGRTDDADSGSHPDCDSKRVPSSFSEVLMNDVIRIKFLPGILGENVVRIKALSPRSY